MIKVFISQPMRGKTDEEILKKISEAIEKVKDIVNEDVKLIDSFIEDDPKYIKNTSLWYLGRSIEFLSDADVAYFTNDWKEARGCKIEHECAKAYGVPIVYEKENKS